MASVRRPKSINASLRWNASVRRPEPSHRHSMLAPMVSVPPDWGREGQHRVARWWLRPPYSGFHLWSWGLVAVVWAWSVVPSVGPKLKPPKPPNATLNWNRQNRQMLHSHTAKSVTKHDWSQKFQTLRSFKSVKTAILSSALVLFAVLGLWCGTKHMKVGNTDIRQNRHALHEANGGCFPLTTAKTAKTAIHFTKQTEALPENRHNRPG